MAINRTLEITNELLNMINPNDHYNGNYKWLKAKLPDGYIDWVTEIKNTSGMYISDEGGDVF